MRRAKGFIACGIVLSLILGTMRVPAAEGTHANDVVAEFPNKIVVVAIRGPNPLDRRTLTARFFKSPRIQKIGGRLFMVGTVHLPLSIANHPHHVWLKDAQRGIAWDEVKRYHVYSFEDFSRTIYERPLVSE
jgi:hypothetical protein